MVVPPRGIGRESITKPLFLLLKNRAERRQEKQAGHDLCMKEGWRNLVPPAPCASEANCGSASALADFFREEHWRRGGVEEQATDGDSVVGGESAEAGKAILELGCARRLDLNLRDACGDEEGRQVGQRQIRSRNAEN